MIVIARLRGVFWLMSDVGRVLRAEKLRQSEGKSIGSLIEFGWALANAFQFIGRVVGFGKRGFWGGGWQLCFAELTILISLIVIILRTNRLILTMAGPSGIEFGFKS